MRRPSRNLNVRASVMAATSKVPIVTELQARSSAFATKAKKAAQKKLITGHRNKELSNEASRRLD
jgi:hypothetical protein